MGISLNQEARGLVYESKAEGLGFAQPASLLAVSTNSILLDLKGSGYKNALSACELYQENIRGRAQDEGEGV